MSGEKSKLSLWEVVKAICTVAIVIVIVVKIYVTPMELTVDFATLLSLLLALFSVALAALFYFKATDTSNTFYDNTYKFTRDIAQLLAKIESGFGERLRHLDEGYSSMRSYFQSSGGRNGPTEFEETKRRLEEEKLEVEKIVEERNLIVQDLLNRSQLEQQERERIASELRSKESELAVLQKEVHRLNRHMTMERVRRRHATSEMSELTERIEDFTKHFVIDRLGVDEVRAMPMSVLKRFFGRITDSLPKPYLEDLEKLGFYEKGLTDEGAHYLKSIAGAGEV